MKETIYKPYWNLYIISIYLFYLSSLWILTKTELNFVFTYYNNKIKKFNNNTLKLNYELQSTQIERILERKDKISDTKKIT